MTNRIRARVLPFAIASLLAMSPAMAQNVTSSAIGGRVVDASGQPVAGATVQIVHVPSGTTKVVTTDADGRYTAQGMRVGGPYDVTASKAGLTQGERDDVYLQLGQVSAINLTMQASEQAAQNLGAITVSANALAQTFSSDNKGLSTNISQRELAATPTPNRSIADIARLDPRIVITDRGEGGISAMGQNTRYNNISVDGVGVGDPFGLNSNGMPYIGSPISFDTIDEYNISTANYDVASDTVGASINAVTKSGTNDFHGSVYYAYRNARHMVGDAGWLDDNDPGHKYTQYGIDWTAGGTLGGPIIKDKLFFFASFEKEKTTGLGAGTGSALDPSLGDGASTSNKVSPGDLQKIIDAANALGLTPGGFGAAGTNLLDKRYLTKLDWNISDNHRASLTWQRTKESQPIIQGNASNSIGLSSYWYTKNSDTNHTVLQLFDDWTENFSTEAKVSYNRFQQLRSGPVQQPAVQVDVNTHMGSFGLSGSAPYVHLGEDQYSHYNAIDVKTWRGFLAGTLYAGDHTFKGGIDYEGNDIYNLFGRTEFGNYTFYGIDNFANGIYGSYNLYQPGAGYTIDDVAAKWKLKQYAFFLQDTWQATDNLSLQFGVRVNLVKTGDKPVHNPAVEQTFATGPDGQVIVDYTPGPGITPIHNDNTIDGMKLIEPRLSFNYNFDTDRLTQLRGGFGLFQSNPPTVWMTNPFQNNGLTTTSYTVYNDDQVPPGTDPCIPDFSPTTQQNVPPASCGGGTTQMAVDTISPDFKLPSVWKFSLAFDRELPFWGTIFSAEYEHVKVRNGIWYQSLNIGAPLADADGNAILLPDGRYQYWVHAGETSSSGSQNRQGKNNAFAYNSTLLSNTHKGHSDALTLMLKKPFSSTWFGNIGVTFSRATGVNGGTSSQANSSFSNSAWVNPNENIATVANYQTDKRLMASLTWQHHFFGNYTTSVTANYDGHTGRPYSWTFDNDANGDSFAYATDLVYIPRDGDVILVQPNGNPATDAQTKQFYDFIKSDSYLRDHQGEIASRNGARSAWVNELDLSLRQEIPGIFAGNKGEIRLDIYNVLNLINSNWGLTRDMGFYNVRSLVDYGGVDAGADGVMGTADDKYIYKLPLDSDGNYQATPKTVYDSGTYTKTNVVSRWSAMLTVSYKF
ncbi:MAG TPA: carboxypeptidase regulatory-like domain-containing protein [Rhodanobacteraceae bacterium]|nr:carboxypeptidase regulatory-like domain-containing protein [Rhodanobacteraceae bacterium]